jgi:hypothetical protein
MQLQPYFDRITIESPMPPLESGLQNLKIREHNDSYIRSLIPQRPVIYSKVAFGGKYTVLYEPVISRTYVRTKIRALLSLKAGDLSAHDIKQIVLNIFGTLENLRISYLECRIDILDCSFKKVFTQLAVLGKHSIDYKYSGQTIYFGKSSSGHQVVLYDKGLESHNQPNNRIRVEARLRFEKKDRPLLEELLAGTWQPKEPFRETYFIKKESLPLKREDKISISKKGLTRFYASQSNNRKTTLRKHIKRNIIIDFNRTFAQWFSSWSGPKQQNHQSLSQKNHSQSKSILINLRVGALGLFRDIIIEIQCIPEMTVLFLNWLYCFFRNSTYD